MHASDEYVAESARRVDQAGSVVIMCGAGCRGAGEELRALSDRLKAPLVHSVKGKEIMPYDDPRWMGGIGMIGTKAVYNAVMDCDLLVMVGTDYPYANFLPSRGNVVQIDEQQQVLGRRAPTVLGVVGSARPTLKLLLDRVAPKNDMRFWDKVTQERRKWDEKLDKQADPARSKDRIHPQAVARTVSDLAKRDAIFALDTGLNTLWSANWIQQSGSQRIIGSFNNAAVGTALGQANGIQALDRTRQVIAMCGDGGFNMLMCEFLTAVHHKLPVKVVIFNNSAFGLITLEAKASACRHFGKASNFRIRTSRLSHAPAAVTALRRGNRASSRPRSTRHSPLTGRRLSTPSWLQTRFRTSHIWTWTRSGISLWPRSRKPSSQSPDRDAKLQNLQDEGEPKGRWPWAQNVGRVALRVALTRTAVTTTNPGHFGLSSLLRLEPCRQATVGQASNQVRKRLPFGINSGGIRGIPGQRAKPPPVGSLARRRPAVPEPRRSGTASWSRSRSTGPRISSMSRARCRFSGSCARRSD